MVPSALSLPMDTCCATIVLYPKENVIGWRWSHPDTEPPPPKPSEFGNDAETVFTLPFQLDLDFRRGRCEVTRG